MVLPTDWCMRCINHTFFGLQEYGKVLNVIVAPIHTFDRIKHSRVGNTIMIEVARYDFPSVLVFTPDLFGSLCGNELVDGGSV
jgi:hypothetical protein